MKGGVRTAREMRLLKERMWEGADGRLRVVPCAVEEGRVAEGEERRRRWVWNESEVRCVRNVAAVGLVR